MSHDDAIMIANDDPCLGWELIEFLMAQGADEFTVKLMYRGNDEGLAAVERLETPLVPFALGKDERELLEGFPPKDLYVYREQVEVYRLDGASLEVLRREVMPRGVMGHDWSQTAFGEDLCVYRAGEPLLTTITHEGAARLTLSPAERTRWEAWRSAIRQAT